MNDATKYEARCLCGSVRVVLAQRPEYIHDCACALCRKSGGLWGYFNCSDVEVWGETQTYERNDLSNPAVQIHFCKSCGATTHWSLTEAHKSKSGPVDHTGVNMRLFHRDQLTGVEVRFPDGNAWSGEGPYDYRRKPVVVGRDDY